MMLLKIQIHYQTRTPLLPKNFAFSVSKFLKTYKNNPYINSNDFLNESSKVFTKYLIRLDFLNNFTVKMNKYKTSFWCLRTIPMQRMVMFFIPPRLISPVYLGFFIKFNLVSFWHVYKASMFTIIVLIMVGFLLFTVTLVKIYSTSSF